MEKYDLTGKSKYSTDMYIGKVFGTDKVLEYLGKKEGRPYLLVECQKCGRKREINGYELERKEKIKCFCMSKNKQIKEKSKENNKYINKKVFDMYIENIKIKNNKQYFIGKCEHNNYVEVQVELFFKNETCKCKCEKEKKLENYSEERNIKLNKKWFNIFYEMKGKIWDNKKIIDIIDILDEEYKKENTYIHIKFECQCIKCGRKVVVNAYNMYRAIRTAEKGVENKKIRLATCICMRSKFVNPEYIGKKFNHLTVVDIKYDEKSGNVFWGCKCDCGKKEIIYRLASIIYNGNLKSCGCQRREKIQENSKYTDLSYIGKVFGRKNNEGGMKVIEINRELKKMGTQWTCECLYCHKMVIRNASAIVKGNIQSCGCHHTENTTFYKDEKYIGKYVNNFKIINIWKKENQYMWDCICPICGKEFSRVAGEIVKGTKKSCGCLINNSYYEYWISQVLEDIRLDYIEQFSFKDLRGKKNMPYCYDFAIFKGDKIVELIEYDGEQHYSSKHFLGYQKSENPEQSFKEAQLRDIRKNEYAKKNNIHLIRFTKTNTKEEMKEYLKELKNKYGKKYKIYVNKKEEDKVKKRKEETFEEISENLKSEKVISGEEYFVYEGIDKGEKEIILEKVGKIKILGVDKKNIGYRWMENLKKRKYGINDESWKNKEK